MSKFGYFEKWNKVRKLQKLQKLSIWVGKLIKMGGGMDGWMEYKPV